MFAQAEPTDLWGVVPLIGMMLSRAESVFCIESPNQPSNRHMASGS
jgi:hypothetical protein